MHAHLPSFDHMLAAWNQRDLDQLCGHLEPALAPDIVFIDPTIETHGIAEFERNVRAFRAKYPTAGLQLRSGIDSHHNLHRYSWEIVLDSAVILVGFDVSETAADGRIARILGFFGPLPKPAAQCRAS